MHSPPKSMLMFLLLEMCMIHFKTGFFRTHSYAHVKGVCLVQCPEFAVHHSGLYIHMLKVYVCKSGAVPWVCSIPLRVVYSHVKGVCLLSSGAVP